MKKLTILFILLTAIVKLEAQQSETLTAAQMREDINYYFDFLKNNHPNLYLKYSPTQYDSLQQALLKQCTSSLSRKDFNRQLLLLNQYTDGHTGITWTEIKHSSFFYFPYFTLRSDSCFLGNELIQTVNNRNIKEIISEIKKGYSWENHPLSNEARINKAFPILLSSYYQIDPPYFIQLKNRETGEIHVDTIPIKKVASNKDPIFQFKFYPEESIALLFYNACLIPGNSEDFFEKALKKAFFQMKEQKIQYLFIDLRLNGGGNSRANELIFKHLKSKKYKGTYYCKVNPHTISVKEAKKANQEYLKKNGTNFWKRYKIKKRIKRLERKIPYYCSTGIDSLSEIIPANKKGFEGKVFVIKSRITYSAAADFCTSVKQRNIGILIGEECGQYFPYAGNMVDAFLPNSHIQFRYATKITYDPDTYLKNGFLQPDIWYDVNKELELKDYINILRK